MKNKPSANKNLSAL